MAYAPLGSRAYRYGNTGRFYGVDPSPTTNKIWTIQVDWDNNGSFDGTNESFYTIDLDISRGMNGVLDSTQEGDVGWYTSASPGTATITFDNSTGRFSAWAQSGGSLNVDMTPGKRVKIMVRNGYSSTDEPLFAGITKTVRENYTAKTVTVTCVDGVEYLQSVDCRDFSLSPKPNTFGEEVATLLPNILPADWKWSYNYDYARLQGWLGYRMIGTNTWEQVKRLARTVDGVAYIQADGDVAIQTLGYGNVNTVATSDYPTSDGWPAVTAYSSSDFLKVIDMSLPWDNIATIIERRYDTVAKAGTSDSIVWEQQGVTTISDALLDFWVDFRLDNQPCIVDSTSVTLLSSDWSVNAEYDGSGSDVTGDISVSYTVFSESMHVTFGNGSTDDEVHFQTLKFRGIPYLLGEYRTIYESTEATPYTGDRRMVLDGLIPPSILLPVGGAGDYNRIALNARTQLLGERPGGGMGSPFMSRVVTVQLQNNFKQFQHELLDLIQPNISIPDLTARGAPDEYHNYYHLWNVRHQWLNNNGQEVLTTWKLVHAPLGDTAYQVMLVKYQN